MKLKPIGIFLILGLMMVQYQNCAPAQNFNQEEVAGEVDKIDTVDVGQIYFPPPQTKVAAASASEALHVVGGCEQTGSIISWSLRTQEGQLIDRGNASCDRGTFEVELSSEWGNFCDENLVLKASLGAKASTTTTIIPECDFI